MFFFPLLIKFQALWTDVAKARAVATHKLWRDDVIQGKTPKASLQTDTAERATFNG